ncbi:hypothetical protein S40293_09925, partial [Stachybotrys chartarum IBT 40293]
VTFLCFAHPQAAWGTAAQKASEFVTKLNVTEKIGIVTGGYRQPLLPCVGSIGPIQQFGFDGICFSDGPAGYSRADGVSVFASGITAAASWDRRLMYERAVALGQEFRDKGSHVHLGPSTGPMGRHAHSGRNWEGFGPDPYLAGIAMNASVSGIQSVGVQACSKHFIANEQETQRTNTVNEDGIVIDAISSDVDDRTLHELYMWPFADAIKAGTASIMCSYNRVNGNYTCANSELLSMLTDELFFLGYVVSDWYATHGTTDYANAGLDLEMPGPVASPTFGSAYFGDLLLEAVKNGTVSENRLDEMAERVLTPYFLLGQDRDFPSVDPASGATFVVYQYGHGSPLAPLYPQVSARNVRGEHPQLIRELGAAATVLLKNVDHTLPLKEHKEVGIFGNSAPYPIIGSVFFGEHDRPEGFEIGTLDVGGGSGTVRHTKLVTPLDAITKKVEAYGGRVQVLLDNKELVDGRLRSIYPTPDVCLLFLKAYASEGHDRPRLELDWDADRAVESTAAVCPNTVVIVHGPGIVLMPWANNENVTAILSAHYPGEETGNSIVDVLWGGVEPSGRLPYTIPRMEVDYGPPIVNITGPVAEPDSWHADFEEGQMIDYRHFDAEGIEPHFDFGFGLSYTQFDMVDEVKLEFHSNLAAFADPSGPIAPGGLLELWNEVAIATVKVTNVGSIAGATVAQLYVFFPQDTTPNGTPIKVLRGFEKLRLESGESKDVTFPLLRRDLSFWHEAAKRWEIPQGEFKFATGFSSKDLRSEAISIVLAHEFNTSEYDVYPLPQEGSAL